MAFALYSKNETRYEHCFPVKLTGESGPLANFLQSQPDASPLSWELDSNQLIPWIDPSLDPGNHVLLLDMLPEASSDVSLYQVTALQGVAYYGATDLVMVCRLFYQSRGQGAARDIKQGFELNENLGHRQMVEAFRLTGGLGTGTYRWARPEMTLGAAICPASKKAATDPAPTPSKEISKPVAVPMEATAVI